jgi:hypothetical protein
MKTLTLALCLFFCLPVAAQFTTVTGTVIDPNRIPYANGTIVPTLVSSSTPTLNGFSYSPPTGPVGLDSTGSFTMNLANQASLSPGGTTWSFNVCSASGTVQPAGGTGPQCFVVTGIVIAGTSQSLSSQLQAAAKALTNTGVLQTNSTTTGYLVVPVVQAGNINIAPSAVANTMIVTQFPVRDVITFTKITINVTTLAAASTMTACIYNSDGTTLIRDSGTFDSSSTGGKTNTVAATTLYPGWYRFGIASTSTTAAASGYSVGSSLLPQASRVINGTAANLISGGVCPSTTGVLTVAGSSSPTALLEP